MRSVCACRSDRCCMGRHSSSSLMLQGRRSCSKVTRSRKQTVRPLQRTPNASHLDSRRSRAWPADLSPLSGLRLRIFISTCTVAFQSLCYAVPHPQTRGSWDVISSIRGEGPRASYYRYVDITKAAYRTSDAMATTPVDFATAVCRRCPDAIQPHTPPPQQ